MTTDEIWDRCQHPDTYFYKFWVNRTDDIEEIYKELGDALDVMDRECNGVFSYHRIPNQNLRKSLIDTLIADSERFEGYEKQINGADVVLVDDSITHGQSIRSAVNAIQTLYQPKSISVFTMFSKLQI